MSDSALPHTQSDVDAKSTVDVFLSYNSRDREAVLKIQKMLGTRGVSGFLDCESLRIGATWIPQLERAIKSVSAIAIFIGEHGLGPWQELEAQLALYRQISEKAVHHIPIIPILLPRAKDEFSFLKIIHSIDLRDGLENHDKIEVIAQTIKGKSLVSIPAETISICPFRGLEAFREQDESLFFGRETFADELLKKVRNNSLIAVVGSSGSGKSSVVQAGLLPRVRREHAPNALWETIIFRPGNRPFHNLANELVALYQPDYDITYQMLAAQKLGDALANGEIPLDVPVTQAMKAAKSANRLLFIVDQFEELFTLTEERDRKPFVNVLLKAAEISPLTIVLTLRGDFYNQAISVSRELSDLMQQGIVNIGSMKREELRDTIVRPAASVGLQFEDGLIERILDNIEDEPGNLPLLEFALTELWEKRQGNRVTNQLYESIGGVEGSISKRAEEVFTSRSPAQQELALRAFTRLVRVAAASEEGTDTRQRVNLQDFDDATQKVLQEFVKARLLVANRNEATNEKIVEVAHEALIRNWDQLKDVLSKDREFLLWRQRLNFLLTEWQRVQKETGKDRDGLLQGHQLNEAKRWSKSRRDELNTQESEFIRKSEDAAKRPKKRLAAVGAVLLIAVLAAWGLKILDDRPASQIKKIMRDSKPLISAVNTWSRHYWLKNLAKTGNLEVAFSESKGIQDAYSRSMALANVTKYLVQAGKNEEAKAAIEAAFNLARSIDDKYSCSIALTEIAKALTIVGQREAARTAIEDALTATSEISHPFSRFDALAKVAQALAQTESYLRAIDTAKIIPDPYFCSLALSNVAKTLAQKGQGELAKKTAKEALAAANKIVDTGSRATALADITQALAITEQIKAAKMTGIKAFNAAKNVGETDLRSTVLASVAEALAHAGLIQEANDVAKEIGKEIGVEPHSFTLASVAKAFVQAKHLEEAKAAAKEARDASKKIKNINSRFYALASVAQAFAQAGDKQAAKLTLDEAFSLIYALGDDRRSRAFSDIAQALAKLSDYRRAREMANSCSNPDDKLSAYAAILQEYAFAEEKISPKLFEQLDREK